MSEIFCDGSEIKVEVLAALPVGERRNLCLSCGACCAFFRASFYYAEADDVTPGGVPVQMTDDLNDFYRVMKGTDCREPYCIALKGTIGQRVGCAIHPVRSNVCRDFPASFEDGVTHNERCDKARAKYGLPPIRPQDWFEKPDDRDRRPPLKPAA